MAKLTVLEMVQDILSDMDSDEVNSIGDTVESLQVAGIIRTSYYELWSNLDLPTREGLIKLDGLSDTQRPNTLKLPDNVKDVDWIKYQNDDRFVDIRYYAPRDFLDTLIGRLGEGTTQPVSFDGTNFNIRNDMHPSIWTTFDNRYVVFDSYNQDFDSTLQQAKSLCYGQYDPDFDMRDDFVPELESKLFPLLLSEAKSSAFINLKQVANSKEEQRSHRGLIRAQNDQWRQNARNRQDRLPNYGRRHP